MKVYLDNSATTMVDRRVIEAMRPYQDGHYGNASSLHSYGSTARKALEESRKAIARAMGARPEEIVFTSGGTESDNLAVLGAARAQQDKGRHVITSMVEHPAVLEACRELEREGFSVTYLGVDSEGLVRPGDLEKAIRKDTVLVSVMHGNNEIGTIQPIVELGLICRKKGIIFHTDAVQSFTKAPIDASRIPLDLVSVSSHKIHGPKGIGALYIRKGTKLSAIMCGGGHERGLRPGTENIPGIVGFAKAAQLAMESAESVNSMARLRNILIERVEKEIPHVKLNGPRGERRLCNNANFSFRFIEGEGLLMRLDMDGIAVSTGSACSTKSLEPSHVLLSIGLSHEVAHGSIRFSLSRFSTEKEINYAVDRLRENVEKLRSMSPLYARASGAEKKPAGNAW